MDAPWIPAALTAVSACTGHAAMCWALGFLEPLEPFGAEPRSATGTVPTLLLLHEAWVAFQHGNVLLNPFCQHLDRNYGVAMLRKGQHWVIASVLVMYWSREVAGMLLCLPYLSLRVQFSIFISVAYHLAKMFSICQDAQRRWSPKFGIMKLLIDHWHYESLDAKLVSLLRVGLQGYDTLVHVFVIRDLVQGLGSDALMLVHWTFGIWLLHAVLNQVSQKSTATLVVEAWRRWLGFSVKKSDERFVVGSSCAVCELLQPRAGQFWKEKMEERRARKEEKPREHRMRQQSLAAMFTVQIGALMYSLVLFYCDSLELGGRSVSPRLVLFLHEAWVMLQHGNVLLNPFCQQLDRKYGIAMLQKNQHWVIASVLVMYWAREVLSMLLCLGYVSYSTQVVILISSVYHLVKMHGICSDAQKRKSAHFGIMRIVIDHWHFETAKQVFTSGLRFFLQGSDTLTHVLIVRDMLQGKEMLQYLHLLFVIWVVHAALNQATQKSTATLVVEAWRRVYRADAQEVSKKCETCRVCSLLAEEERQIDLVFLSHPAWPSSVFSLFSSSPSQWRPRWWMTLLGPLLSPLVPLLWPLLRGNFCEVAEDLDYGGVRAQNWVLTCFGYQYMLWPFRSLVAQRIKGAAEMAEEKKVKVLCLGALNKAEFMHNGGLGLLREASSMRIVHGNTLTAAAVLETSKALFHERPVFVTGASSKVGSAVVRGLLQQGFEVYAHSSDAGRLKKLLAKAVGRLHVTMSLVDGLHVSQWVVGKCDKKVMHYLPQGAKAVVFSVPNPLEGRPDLEVVSGGILHLEPTRLSKPRQFANLLASHEIYACHAAGLLAAKHGWPDELGEVSLEDMPLQWQAAMSMGFSLPPVPIQSEKSSEEVLRRSVIVVGAGPSGLAAAASLVQHGEDPSDIVLFERQDSIQGSWYAHFEDLTITTRASTCGLPGLPIELCTKSDELTTQEYVNYLRSYAARFALDVQCQVEVLEVEVTQEGWNVRVRRGEEVSTWSCLELIVATGKNVQPRIPAQWAEGNVIHSTGLRGPRMEEAVAAARAGELLLVGFGNSAADIANLLLRRAPEGLVHVSMRRLPPIVRRQWGWLRMEQVARLLAWLCDKNGDRLMNWMMYVIEGDLRELFPRLNSWGARQERHIPTVDRDGSLVRHVRQQRLLCHGPACQVELEDSKVRVRFEGEDPRSFQLVVLCTGYEAQEVLDARAHQVGLGPEPKDLLPLRGIGREAQRVAAEVGDLLRLKRRRAS